MRVVLSGLLTALLMLAGCGGEPPTRRPAVSRGVLRISEPEGAKVHNRLAWNLQAGSSGNVIVHLRDLKYDHLPRPGFAPTVMSAEFSAVTMGEDGGYAQFGMAEGEIVRLEVSYEVWKAKDLLDGRLKTLFGESVVSAVKKDHPQVVEQSALIAELRFRRSGAVGDESWRKLAQLRLPDGAGFRSDWFSFESEVQSNQVGVLGHWLYRGKKAEAPGTHNLEWTTTREGIKPQDPMVDWASADAKLIGLEIRFAVP